MLNIDGEIKKSRFQNLFCHYFTKKIQQKCPGYSLIVIRKRKGRIQGGARGIVPLPRTVKGWERSPTQELRAITHINKRRAL